jgi:putative DNA primase/helicase
MQAATSLVTWHLYEARRFIGEIALPVVINNALRLDDWLLEYCRMNRVGEVTRRTIQQMGPVCVRDRRILDNALEELVDAGRVQVEKDGRRKLVKINPALLGG